ncbi:MAG TPA: TetR/AcrR family transcriptional regulator [Anaerolineae bacterium]|nr:TetR/AcrR family transcriptional regulator [Anaerolineae bacterium]
MTQRRAEREDQLLETASRLFKEKGYHNTSMQDLADALGLQKGSLYYYIDSKKELLRQMLEHATSFLADQIDEIYSSDLPPPDKLRWALEHHAVTMMDHLDLVTVYLQEYRNLPPKRLQEALAVRKHYEQVLMQIVQDGIALGDFCTVDVKMAIFGLLGMLNWTHEWFSPDGQFSSQEIAVMLTDLALYGLMKRET